MRKLASIQRVTEIVDHPQADRLSIARILGWNVVVGRREFDPGQLCCYIETDSVLPERPEFEFLRTKQFRIKTVRLRGCVSQGIAFPIEKVLPTNTSYFEGDDVTELLGVTLFVNPLELTTGGDALGGFPHFVSKTDETRIQSVPGVLERWKGVEFDITEKLEGCSATYAVYQGAFYCCGRTQRLADRPASLYWHIAHRLRLEEKLRAQGRDIVIQGEIVGPKVQGNWYDLKALDLFIFNSFDPATHTYGTVNEVRTQAEQLGIKAVPYVGRVTLNHSVDQLVQMATVKSTLKPDRWAEGLIFRPVVEARDTELGRLSFKCINPIYLLEKKD